MQRTQDWFPASTQWLFTTGPIPGYSTPSSRANTCPENKINKSKTIVLKRKKVKMDIFLKVQE